MSAGLYYRRWTRMYIKPATKYLKKYDVIQEGMEHLLHLANIQNPAPENKPFYRRTMVNHEEQINNKLINNLFLKYPDLKYQSINRQKYQGDNFNSYSYSYAFITEQKKLMKAGYTIKKAFELVQAKFQEKMKRKIDQTLISRGLAIGNRARSLLTIYQQQVEQESRLKMLRTKRQVLKYEQQLREIDNALNKPIDAADEQEAHYERIFQKITDESNELINKEFSNEKRGEMIQRMQSEFQNMFSQFYETAGYKDRLRGLSDEEIKEEIMTSPSKIKRLSRELVKYLKKKGGVSINASGEIKMSENIDAKLRSFINSSPTIKIAILHHLLGYENPFFSQRRKMETQAKQRLSALRDSHPDRLDEESKNTIKENKLQQLQLVVEKTIPEDSRVYKLLESAEERMVRLQITYLKSLLETQENPENSIFDRLKTVVEEFRRLKFRMEKRHKNIASGELIFPEHFTFEKHPNEIEGSNVEYEDLLEYLRRKSEERRLKAIDQVDDNKINQMIKKQACQETPVAEGEVKDQLKH